MVVATLVFVVSFSLRPWCKAMESVEGMMKNLQLSAVEKRGLRIGSAGRKVEAGGGVAQALGKVMSEKMIHAENCGVGFG